MTPDIRRLTFTSTGVLVMLVSGTELDSPSIRPMQSTGGSVCVDSGPLYLALAAAAILTIPPIFMSLMCLIVAFKSSGK